MRSTVASTSGCQLTHSHLRKSDDPSPGSTLSEEEKIAYTALSELFLDIKLHTYFVSITLPQSKIPTNRLHDMLHLFPLLFTNLLDPFG